MGRIQEQKFKSLISPISSRRIITRKAVAKNNMGTVPIFKAIKSSELFEKLSLTSRYCVQEFPQRSTTKITRIRRVRVSARIAPTKYKLRCRVLMRNCSIWWSKG